MPRGNFIFLMYHELEIPGRATCLSEPSYLRYVVSKADFQRQISALKAHNFSGIDVTSALESDSGGPAVVLTFDDGCETDLLVAAPVLLDAAFRATFHVVVGFLGRSGYMTSSQLRELSSLGFEIASHSMTHAYLDQASSDLLRREIVEAKDKLEQLLGRSVAHFSCPGGRWSPRVAAMAREAGFRTVSTSRIAANSPRTNPYRLARIAVLRDTREEDLLRTCHAKGLLHQQIRQRIFDSAKKVLGNHLYDSLRRAVFAKERH